jgi:hypothetical protein
MSITFQNIKKSPEGQIQFIKFFIAIVDQEKPGTEQGKSSLVLTEKIVRKITKQFITHLEENAKLY